MMLPFEKIHLTEAEWDALLAVSHDAILIEHENQQSFYHLKNYGFVEIESIFNWNYSAAEVPKGGTVTKLAARITKRGKDYIGWSTSKG